jgi:hypothetical protein
VDLNLSNKQTKLVPTYQPTTPLHKKTAPVQAHLPPTSTQPTPTTPALHASAHLCRSLRILCMRPYSRALNHSPTSFRLVLNHSRSLRARSSARSVVS